MLKKLMLVLAAVGLVAVPAYTQSESTVVQVIAFCQAAYEKNDEKFVTENMDKLDSNTQKVVALACMSYAVGYANGYKAKQENNT